MAGFSLPYYGEDYYNPDTEVVDPEELRRQQEVSLQEHAAYAKNLQGLQDQVRVRGEDLDISKQLLQATSPQIPKGVREFLLRGISTNVGVDPKGDYANNLIKMFSGLDPQSLEGVRAAFGSEIPNADPGHIKNNVRAVFTGQVPVSELITRVAQRAPAGVPQVGDQAGPGEDKQTGVTEDRRKFQPTPQETAAGNVRRLPTIGETAPRDQPTDPGLMHELGLDPTQKARNDDVLRLYPGIPMDPEGQRKLRSDLQENSANASNAVNSAMQLHNLFRGRPETIGVVGATIRTIDEVVDQINGAARALGVTAEKLDVGAPGIRTGVKAVTDHIIDLYEKSGLEKTAVDSARVQSQVLQMAYDMAIARGIPGNRLTNGIIAQQLVTLGKSASKEQFEGVLADVVERSLDQGAAGLAAKLGSREYYPSLNNVPDQQLKDMSAYIVSTTKDGQPSVIPQRYKEKLMAELENRATAGEAAAAGQEPNRGQKIPLTSPTIQEEEKARQSNLIREEQRKNQELETKVRGEERAQATAERAQKIEVRKLDQEQQRILESNRRYELAVKKEEREATYQKQKAIIDAFRHLGASIAAGQKAPNISTSGVSAPEQDTSAFRMAPSPQRRPPQPIDASRYQRGGK